MALLIVVASAFAIIRFAGVGSLHGRTIRLYVVSDQASGVMHGTEVWVAGQKVGVVTDVAFLAPTSDSTAHVVMTLDVLASDARVIRRDAQPDLRAGANVLGPIVVYMEPGTPAAPPVRDGDTLRGFPQRDVQRAMTRLGDATAEVGPLLSDMRAVAGDVRDRSGTVGALLQHGLPLPALRARYTRVTTRDGTGEAETDLMIRARGALARVDSVRALLAGSSSIVGRFRRDASLAGNVADVRAQLDVLSAELQRANGTAGRLETDAAVLDAVAAARLQLTDLLADIRRHPARYVNF